MALILSAINWNISPPKSSHGVAGAIGFTVIAWLLWFLCLAPVWVPYLVNSEARRTRSALFIGSALLLLVASAVLAFLYLCGDRYSHWVKVFAAAILASTGLVRAYG